MSFLPAAFQNPSSSTTATTRPCDNGQRQQLAPPSVCVTGVMFKQGQLTVSRTLLEDGSTLSGTIRYRIFRPRQLKMLPAPLVILHGGPSVPSNYLLSIVNVITDRCLIFYDQLGCGTSSAPPQKECYSIQHHCEDLKLLLRELKFKHYHLYGQSWGGILAFEFLKMFPDQVMNEYCLSVALSSSPTSTQLVEEESKRLLEEIDCPDEQRAANFRITHECRLVPAPISLQGAYAQAGSIWRGMKALPDYKATLLTDNGEKIKCPALVTRGQYDFCTEKCVQDWHHLFENVESLVLAGCSHHCLLENEQLYGDMLMGFLQDSDL